VVHVVVVLLPLAVLASVVLVAVPATRRAFGLLTLITAFVACAAIPVAFLSGSKLSAEVPHTSLVSRHIQLAHQLLPLAALFGIVLAVFVFVDMARRSQLGLLNTVEARMIPARPSRSRSSGTGGHSTAHRVSAALLVILAVLTGIQTYRVGDAGAKASWSGRLGHASAPPAPTGAKLP